MQAFFHTSCYELWLGPVNAPGLHGPPPPTTYLQVALPGQEDRSSTCSSYTVDLHSGTRVGYTDSPAQDRSPHLGREQAALSEAGGAPSPGHPLLTPREMGGRTGLPQLGRVLSGNQDPGLVQLCPSFLGTQLLHPPGLAASPIALKLLSPRVTMTQCDPEPSQWTRESPGRSTPCPLSILHGPQLPGPSRQPAHPSLTAVHSAHDTET